MQLIFKPSHMEESARETLKFAGLVLALFFLVSVFTTRVLKIWVDHYSQSSLAQIDVQSSASSQNP